MTHGATFFITTARAGTQWLAAALSRTYSDVMEVAHEPLDYAYRPKQYLRADDRLDELRARPEIASHFDRIHQVLRTKSYVEVGFPCFALAPLLLSEFGSSLRLVQLVRHPVRVAASSVTHRWYQGTRGDTLPQDIELEPTDAGVLQKNYLDRWDSMSPYEKALFYWSEVHLFAEEINARFEETPFHCTRFEDLVARRSARAKLAKFLGVPYRDGWGEFVAEQVDEYHLRTAQPIDVGTTGQHAAVVALGETHGYDLTSPDAREIRTRYEISRRDRLVKRVRNKVARFGQLLSTH
jgi:Sulfotransferase domain